MCFIISTGSVILLKKLKSNKQILFNTFYYLQKVEPSPMDDCLIKLEQVD